MVETLLRADATRVISDLRELASLTSDERGAQRVAFTETWDRARTWLRSKLSELPVSVFEDGARNLWATLPGAAGPPLAVGSHLDSVPDGGWLDGALGVAAGLEILRAAGPHPPRSLVLVDWADEEGRFGHSLLGSSASAGMLDLEALRAGGGLEMLAVEELTRAREQRPPLHGYLELHIEQGPVLESIGKPLAAVAGTYGVRRERLRFLGTAAHAGATPLQARRDPVLAAARFVEQARRSARELDGLATVGVIESDPRTATAVARECRLVVDARHAEAGALAALHGALESAASEIAAASRVDLEREELWRVEPIAFDRELVAMAQQAVGRCGPERPLTSGPLHDAAALAAAGVRTAMLFVRSLGGVSHTAAEDSSEADIHAAVAALGRLASAAMGRTR